MTREKDLRRVVKERSCRLENDAKKQNDYQERRLGKFISSMEKEHDGKMTQLRAIERELHRKSDELTDRIERTEHYVFDQNVFDAQHKVNEEITRLLEPPKLQRSSTVNVLYGVKAKQFKKVEAYKQPRSNAIKNWQKLTPVMMAAVHLLRKHGAQGIGCGGDLPTNFILTHGFAANYTKSASLPSVEGGQNWNQKNMDKQMFSNANKLVRLPAI